MAGRVQVAGVQAESNSHMLDQPLVCLPAGASASASTSAAAPACLLGCTWLAGQAGVGLCRCFCRCSAPAAACLLKWCANLPASASASISAVAHWTAVAFIPRNKWRVTFA